MFTTYELLILFRIMPKAELKDVLRRTANLIFDKGGNIKKLESLGLDRDMPYKTSKHGLVHHKANYFLFEFIIPPNSVRDILDEYGRDVDIVRRRVFAKRQEEPFECTLHEELLPAPYRKDVQELLATAKKTEKKSKYSFETLF